MYVGCNFFFLCLELKFCSYFFSSLTSKLELQILGVICFVFAVRIEGNFLELKFVLTCQSRNKWHSNLKFKSRNKASKFELSNLEGLFRLLNFRFWSYFFRPLKFELQILTHFLFACLWQSRVMDLIWFFICVSSTESELSHSSFACMFKVYDYIKFFSCFLLCGVWMKYFHIKMISF